MSEKEPELSAEPILAQSSDPRDFEQKHVHQIYGTIAEHFSDTRYKPWPVVKGFLAKLPCGSIGSDLGCGNGKYMELVPGLFSIGNDRCEKLISLAACKKRSSDVFVGDHLQVPFRSNALDFAISIAVIHHFASPERRCTAIREMVRILRPGGQFVVYVWAFEQQGKRKFECQDTMVSWSMPLSYTSHGTTAAEKDQTLHRYYHLFQEGELDALASSIPDLVIDVSGYERDNWFIIGHKKARTVQIA